MPRWPVTSQPKAVSRVRGTRDLLVDELQRHRAVLDVLQRTVERFGFRSTPLLEYTDLFSRSLGDGSDIVMKEMYTFQDNSGKSVTLRPEGTAGILRALVSNNLLFSLPQKLSYSGSMFRYERPQRGRYREFQQFGVEFVGCSGPSVDIEVIAMASDALGALGIKDKVVLELNSLGDNDSRARYRATLEAFFAKCKENLLHGVHCHESTESIENYQHGRESGTVVSQWEEQININQIARPVDIVWEGTLNGLAFLFRQVTKFTIARRAIL